VPKRHNWSTSIRYCRWVLSQRNH